MPRTFTVDIDASKAAIARVMKEKTRQAIAQRLRGAGDAAAAACNDLSTQFEPRTEERRRNPGSPEIARSFEVRYSSLAQVSSGQMTFRIASQAPSFWYLEYGTGPHEIAPSPGKRLWWPGVLMPPGVSVHHPGSTRYKGIFRRAVAAQVRRRFPGLGFLRGMEGL
jgi:hypothetical protein